MLLCNAVRNVIDITLYALKFICFVFVFIYVSDLPGGCRFLIVRFHRLPLSASEDPVYGDILS